ncbi:Glycine/D-amino acid oxidase, putative (deaminating) [Pseudomonas chlororaphis subsp. aurantiaca]|uniref:N-methyl-L-tryptophan oxidase n=1 Tax=Pseudomonas chlororaphis TaxID=587753 RepID=UPI000F58215D|nr:N-methyl-L-tryptophan oxidase [Pseudomonas chlororaphis]AZD35132.1 Glycine/D-amino acid oxidase, putative (deaminating) [Pseudomonas chlororaphis subsp. aurantiaca]AZD41466.1 Glycine/D-amino acid oxidase, putative (deaminating) [Pseudomonas chlororaphis subsp. aurantiaca]AZD60202.1 Glycine/D-amino acid oxidase, putative (deaminating) [Pseudomonas chlororaphis subsp. aurantiaca]AZD78849.1 Glycine/D-amino acid oxidase, putative (deaminating) [Pseudomonas chlororaphis subsp. aurantiaca]
MQTPEFDVVVVGLGAMGAATLYQLAKRGVKVAGIDRFAPPHDQGSSHGDTRITRQAVGEGAAYVPLAIRAQQIWRELEAQLDVPTEQPLFEQCGVLVMTSSATPGGQDGTPDFTENTLALARQFGIAHEVLDAAQIRQRFPQFAPIHDSALGYFEPGGGYVRPERCIDAQLSLARQLGATLITGETVLDIKNEQDLVQITSQHRRITAAKVVVCAGMWSSQLLGAPFDKLLRVCRQTLYWYQLAEPVIFPEHSPSFIVHGASDEQTCYGFPPIPGEGSMKIATEQYSETSTPDSLDRQVSAAQSEAMYRDLVLANIAGVTPQLVKSAVCAYTVTPDSHFIIDEHPRLANVTVVSACSGHGFKHSAAIGEALAQRLVDGRSEIDLSAFSLARFDH